MGDNDEQHHRLDYAEIPVTDFAVAKRFYGEAFGWQFNDYGPGPAYVGILGRGPEEVAGFRLEEEVTPGGPLLVLFSTDLEASAEAVRRAGGEVVEGPFAFPGGRRFHFRDPFGNELGVWAE